MVAEASKQRRRVSPPDIYIEPSLLAFSGGDFFKLKELFAAAQPSKEMLKRELDSYLTKRLTAAR